MTKSIIDINEIMSLIPHRYPLLLVDKIIDINIEKKSIIGIKNISFNEPQFQGHFPGNPIMPGVLIVEAMAQVSAVLVAKTLDSDTEKEVLFVSIENTKFRKPVIPGDSLEIYSSIEQSRNSVWKFSSQVKVDNELVAESKFTAMVKIKDR